MKTENVVMGTNDYCVPIINVAVVNAAKTLLHQYWVARAPQSATDWTKYEKTIPIDNEAAYIHVCCGLSSCTGTAWFDDLKIVECSAPAEPELDEVLLNPLAPIIIPMPWQEDYGSQLITISNPAIVTTQTDKNIRSCSEIQTFISNLIGGGTPPVVTSLEDAASYQTLLVVGDFSDSIVSGYLNTFGISVNQAELGSQSYVLAVRRDISQNQNIVILAGNTENSIYYAVQSLKQYPILQNSQYKMIEGVITDKPSYLWRGLVPGGSMNLSRVDTWMVPLKLNVFYGPSDVAVTAGSYDWRVPFTSGQKAGLASFVADCSSRFITTVGGTRPDRGYVPRIQFSSEADVNAILQKYQDYYDCGIRVFNLAFDDGPSGLQYAEDISERYNPT